MNFFCMKMSLCLHFTHCNFSWWITKEIYNSVKVVLVKLKTPEKASKLKKKKKVVKKLFFAKLKWIRPGLYGHFQKCDWLLLLVFIGNLCLLKLFLQPTERTDGSIAYLVSENSRLMRLRTLGRSGLVKYLINSLSFILLSACRATSITSMTLLPAT